jgi:hypothetical protein
VAYIVNTHHRLKKQAREREAEVSGLPILAALWLPWPLLEGVAEALLDEGKGLLQVRVCGLIEVFLHVQKASSATAISGGCACMFRSVISSFTNCSVSVTECEAIIVRNM